ncbi:lipase maturation factor 1 isoform X3 [Prionailurus viverrinus]|uniref:lipase maturation factor 1 isoform X3 n=1 Tax=Prionailurus viverrinus TaxID=61388 RepID=UPI001FF17819|nr:lipase maturation factor 1 isoform X3 [Prionailurus viverrinus]
MKGACHRPSHTHRGQTGEDQRGPEKLPCSQRCHRHITAARLSVPERREDPPPPGRPHRVLNRKAPAGCPRCSAGAAEGFCRQRRLKSQKWASTRRKSIGFWQEEQEHRLFLRSSITLKGWESQLLETGFLGIFLCPLWTLSRLPTGTPPSQIVLWGFRWLIFRIMLGAGLIKIRGDRCWRDLTCMDFHYETQPVPNPMAYLLHQSPWWAHRFETLSNHFLELVVPFFIFLGRRLCILHGALQILFQVVLVISGNLSFLNWLTMVPSVACFDDAALGFLFPSGPGGLKDRVRKMQEEVARGARPTLRYGCVVRQAVHVALGILVAWLSVPVVLNLLSPAQVMNTSFNSLRIVNTYGAFGSITKERTEVILQGTASPNASAPDAVWEDYGFKCKPGDLGRRPCLISPYHYRLDWLMWFAAFQGAPHVPGSVPTARASFLTPRPTSTTSGSFTWQGSSWPTTGRLCPYWPSTLSRTGPPPGGSGESTTGTSSAAWGAGMLRQAGGGSGRGSAPTSPHSACETWRATSGPGTGRSRSWSSAGPGPVRGGIKQEGPATWVRSCAPGEPPPTHTEEGVPGRLVLASRVSPWAAGSPSLQMEFSAESLPPVPLPVTSTALTPPCPPAPGRWVHTGPRPRGTRTPSRAWRGHREAATPDLCS